MEIREQAYRGMPLSVPVIDAHTHILSDSYMGYYQAIRTNAEIVELMDHLGIDCIVTTPHTLILGDMLYTNQCTADSAAEFPGRIYGYMHICPQRGLEETKQTIQTHKNNHSFVGFKFLPGYHGPLSGSEYDYAMDFAEEAGCPVLSHIWSGDPAFADVEAAVRKRPRLKLLIAHQGGGSASFTDSYVALMNDYPNLHMEICGSLFNSYSMEDYVEMVGEDRVIYGSDQINLDPRYDLGQVVFSTLPDNTKKKILAENFLKLLEGSSLGQIKIGV